MAHDEDGTCREGDTVAIVECRPIIEAQGLARRRDVERAPKRRQPRRRRAGALKAGAPMIQTQNHA